MDTKVQTPPVPQARVPRRRSLKARTLTHFNPSTQVHMFRSDKVIPLAKAEVSLSFACAATMAGAVHLWGQPEFLHACVLFAIGGVALILAMRRRFKAAWEGLIDMRKQYAAERVDEPAPEWEGGEPAAGTFAAEGATPAIALPKARSALERQKFRESDQTGLYAMLKGLVAFLLQIWIAIYLLHKLIPVASEESLPEQAIPMLAVVSVIFLRCLVALMMTMVLTGSRINDKTAVETRFLLKRLILIVLIGGGLVYLASIVPLSPLFIWYCFGVFAVIHSLLALAVAQLTRPLGVR